MILDALHRLTNPFTAEQSQSLSREEARAVMSDVLTGKCTDAQIAAMLIALRMPTHSKARPRAFRASVTELMP